MQRLIIAVFICLPLLATAQTLSIRSDTWFPMNGDPSSDKPGYMIDLAKAIFEPHGISIDYQLMPWERALHEVRAGRIDCVVGAYIEDAPDFAFPEQPWGIDQVMFFVRDSDDWRYSGELQSLLQRKVGMIGGYAYGAEYDSFAEQYKDTTFFFMAGDAALDKNIKKLTAERLDTLVENKLVMVARLKQMGLRNAIKPAGALTDSMPMYIACSPDSDKTQRFMLPMLQADGTVSTILEDYGLEPWW